MGVFSIKPIKLYAEPRLWGVWITDDARNPPEWRGRRIAFEQMSRLGGGVHAYPLLNETGVPEMSEGRPLVVVIPMGTQRTLHRAGARWINRRFADGTIDVVVRSPGPLKSEKAAGVVVGVLMLLFVGVMAWSVLKQHASVHPSHREWYDLPALLLVAAFPVFVFGATVGMMLLDTRRSIRAYRLTANALTPLDGPLAGRAIERSAISRYWRGVGNSLNLRVSGQTLRVQQPPISFSKWMDDEAAEKLRRRRSYIRYGWIMGIAVVVTTVLAFVLPRPERAPSPPGANDPVMIVVLVALLIMMMGASYAADRFIARRRRREQQLRRASRVGSPAASA